MTPQFRSKFESQCSQVKSSLEKVSKGDQSGPTFLEKGNQMGTSAREKGDLIQCGQHCKNAKGFQGDFGHKHQGFSRVSRSASVDLKSCSS